MHGLGGLASAMILLSHFEMLKQKSVWPKNLGLDIVTTNCADLAYQFKPYSVVRTCSYVKKIIRTEEHSEIRLETMTVLSFVSFQDLWDGCLKQEVLWQSNLQGLLDPPKNIIIIYKTYILERIYKFNWRI